MKQEADWRQRTHVQKARDRLCCPPLITCGLAERRPKTIYGCEWKEELVFVPYFFISRSMLALLGILLVVPGNNVLYAGRLYLSTTFKCHGFVINFDCLRTLNVSI